MFQNSETSHQSLVSWGWRPNEDRELDNMAPLRTADRVLLVCDYGVFRRLWLSPFWCGCPRGNGSCVQMVVFGGGVGGLCLLALRMMVFKGKWHFFPCDDGVPEKCVSLFMVTASKGADVASCSDMLASWGQLQSSQPLSLHDHHHAISVIHITLMLSARVVLPSTMNRSQAILAK